MIVGFCVLEGNTKTEELLYDLFKTISALNPSKDASSYWLSVNRKMLGFSDKMENLWKEEKQATLESIAIAKEEALTFFANEREKIMRLSHEEALLELVRVRKIESRIKTIRSVTDNRLLEIR